MTLNDSHLPWELHLEHSCKETAGPAGAHRSPPARRRHSRPHRCCSHTAPSAPPRPTPTTAPERVTDSWTPNWTAELHPELLSNCCTECCHSRRNSQIQWQNRDVTSSAQLFAFHYWPFCHLIPYYKHSKERLLSLSGRAKMSPLEDWRMYLMQ